MKKLCFLILALLLPLLAHSKQVTELQAMSKAQQFMQGKTLSVSKSRRFASKRGVKAAAIYVFNANEGGFVVVSGDDRTAPILGYSMDGRLDADNLPDNVQSWLDSYADQIELLQEYPEMQTARKVVSGASISPLLGEMKWGQGTPYNDMCPVIDGQRCLTGCVATAMAQVMCYHKWPMVSNGIPSYTTRTAGLVVEATPAGSIDWENMLPTYPLYSVATAEQKRAVASLMQKCGSALQMDYGLEGSSASVSFVANALKNYFDYDATTSYLQRSNYGLQRWSQRIYDELASGRPVVYGGQRLKGEGHAFVIDGYDKDDFFHVNWGWNGMKDSYFLLTILDPDNIGEENGFSQTQEAVVGIQKNTGIVPDTPQDGEVFTELTPEGIEMTFMVISSKENTCQVGDGKEPAIDQETTGTVTIPSMAQGYDVVSIGQRAFYKCSKMSSMVIPISIDNISYYAIWSNDVLESLDIPASVTSIDDYAFGDNANLKRFVVDSGNPSFMSRDGILYNKKGTLLRSYPSGLTGEFTIPSDVPYVNNGAFSGTCLTKLTFPETVTSVGGWVATSCPNLTTVVWKASKAELPSCAFRYNRKLENVELCEGITAIPIECFMSTAIKDIDIPKSVQSLGAEAFYNCSQLERISFSTRMMSFKSRCLSDCENLKDIVITYQSQALFQAALPEATFHEKAYDNATLHVPTGSGDFFRTADEWKRFKNIVEEGDPMPEVQQAEGDLWGYYAGEEPLDDYWINGGYSETHVAMFIPGDATVRGAQITALRIPVLHSEVPQMEQGTIWLAENLESGLKVCELSMEALIGDKYTEYVLSEPYTITSQGVYVGFSCPANVYVNRTSSGGVIGSYYRKNNNGKWNSTSSYRLGLQIRLNNHHLPEASAEFCMTDQTKTYPGELTYSTFRLLNDGKEVISSIDYTISIDGEREARHLETDVPNGISQYKDVSIGVTGPAQPGKVYTVSVTIDKVNGKTNVAAAKTVTQQFQNLSRQVVRRTVMEEGTGTWCTYCPRGMAAMQHAKDLYGDRFIGIAIHNSYSSSSGIDPMDLDLSYPVYFSSLPSCKIDRASETFDPYDDTFSPKAQVNLLEAAMQMATNVDVTVSGVWNDDKTQVEATSVAEFLDGGEGYRVEYVLVADGVKHDGTAWYQTNGYSGSSSYASDPYMKPYVEASNPMTGVTYNDVMISSSYSGGRNLADPYTGGFAAGEKKTNRYTLTLPASGELAEAIDKDQVYVIAIVTNADGTIANAAKAKVTTRNGGAQKGDVNEDGFVNVTDIAALVNVIMKRKTYSNADVNADGFVNVTDIAALVNVIMKRTSADMPMDMAESRGSQLPLLTGDDTNKVSVGAEQPSCSNGSSELVITMTNPQMDVTMMQMDITLPEGLTISSADGTELVEERASRFTHQLLSSMSSNGRNIRLLLLSGSNALVEGNEGGIIRLALTVDEHFRGGDIVLHDILCTSPDLDEARPADTVISIGSSTGIGIVENSRFGDGKCYDLQGRRLDIPANKKGVTIISGKKIIR